MTNIEYISRSFSTSNMNDEDNSAADWASQPQQESVLNSTLTSNFNPSVAFGDDEGVAAKGFLLGDGNVEYQPPQPPSITALRIMPGPKPANAEYPARMKDVPSVIFVGDEDHPKKIIRLREGRFASCDDTTTLGGHESFVYSLQARRMLVGVILLLIVAIVTSTAFVVLALGKKNSTTEESTSGISGDLSPPVSLTYAPSPSPTILQLTLAPVEPPAAAPVAETNAPVEAPVAAPIAPVSAPVAAPIKEPTTPVLAPVAAPTAKPNAPVEAPVPAPTTKPNAPVEAPVPAPTAKPNAPVEAPVPAPTDAPKRAPVEVPAASPTSEPDVPVEAPVSAPTPEPNVPVEASIQVDKTTYTLGENIVITFENNPPMASDWVAMQNVTDGATTLWTAVLWVWTCGTRTCTDSPTTGTVVFGQGGVDEGDFDLLGPGKYVMHLLRGTGSYDSFAKSPEFAIVADVAAPTTL
jgi:hypothetical protein